MAQNTITTAQLNEQILKYLKPEITLQPTGSGTNLQRSEHKPASQAEGKFLTYQWHKNGQPIAGATGKSFSDRGGKRYPARWKLQPGCE